MRVKELIIELQKCNQDWDVTIEGCDCYGKLDRVSGEYLKEDKEVFLGRVDGDLTR